MSNNSSSKSTVTPTKPTIPSTGCTVLCQASGSPCNRISRNAVVWVTDASIAECWDAVLPSNSLTNALVWMKNTTIVNEDEAGANGWMAMCADCFKYWYDDDGDGDGAPASDENVKWWRYNLVVQRVIPKPFESKLHPATPIPK